MGTVLPGEEVLEEVGEVCSELRDWRRKLLTLTVPSLVGEGTVSVNSLFAAASPF